MPTFCESCHSLLEKITGSDVFYYKCRSCLTIYKPTAEDTLLKDVSSGAKLSIHKTILKNAAHDPVNPKAYNKCPECQAEIVKQVQLGEDKRLINVCTCKKIWIEGLE